MMWFCGLIQKETKSEAIGNQGKNIFSRKFFPKKKKISYWLLKQYAMVILDLLDIFITKLNPQLILTNISKPKKNLLIILI